MPDDVARAEVTSAINVVVQIVRKRERRFVSQVSLVDPSAHLHGGAPVTPLFVGDFRVGLDVPVFTQVAGLGPDTELGIKMTDAGLDPRRWEDVS
jgi:hypothetical protein